MEDKQILFNIIDTRLRALPEEEKLNIMNLYNHLHGVHSDLYPMKSFDHVLRHYSPSELLRKTYGCRGYDNYFTVLHDGCAISFEKKEDYQYFVPLSDIINHIVHNHDSLGLAFIDDLFKLHVKAHAESALFRILKNLSENDIVRLYNAYCTDFVQLPRHRIYSMDEMNEAFEGFSSFDVTDYTDNSNFSLNSQWFVVRPETAISSDNPYDLITDHEIRHLVDFVLRTGNHYAIYPIKEYLVRLHNHLPFHHHHPHLKGPKDEND